MDKENVINKTKEFVKTELANESTGHDWWHAHRVWQNAIHIMKKEMADSFIIELAALLHDIADQKFHDGDEKIGLLIARNHLNSLSVSKNQTDHICKIIETVSFSKGTIPPTFEGKVVQDADRLDAMGSIGIARAFAFGGHIGRPIYDPNIRPEIFHAKAKKKNEYGPSINHFYEKLLLLKDKMNTTTGKEIAISRHKYMLQFLDKFFEEWEGLS